jgi:hypothetical protein
MSAEPNWYKNRDTFAFSSDSLARNFPILYNTEYHLLNQEGGSILRVTVIDGQGGRIGKLLVESIKAANIACQLVAVGTNSIATAAMLKAGADAGATGENPVIAACRDSDILVCPIGLLIADALYGEVTPTMAVAVGQSKATKLLLPVTHCDNIVIGTQSMSISRLISMTVTHLQHLVNGTCPHCSSAEEKD